MSEQARAAALDVQMTKTGMVQRGVLLRTQAADLPLLASESSLPTDLVTVAHEARLTAIAADPKLNTVTETEAIVQAVLDQQAKEAQTAGQVALDIRKQVIRQLVKDLNFPTPKNPAVQLAFARLGARLDQYVAAHPNLTPPPLTLPDVTP